MSEGASGQDGPLAGRRGILIRCPHCQATQPLANTYCGECGWNMHTPIPTPPPSPAGTPSREMQARARPGGRLPRAAALVLLGALVAVSVAATAYACGVLEAPRSGPSGTMPECPVHALRLDA